MSNYPHFKPTHENGKAILCLRFTIRTRVGSVMQIARVSCDPFTENPVTPTLIEEHQRYEDKRHYRHRPKGIWAGSRIVDRQTVIWINRGDQYPGIEDQK